MNERMLELRQRRGELIARIDVQRGQLAELGESWKNKFALADRGVSVARFLRAHPLLLAGASTLLVVRRRGITGLLRGSLMLWKGYRLFLSLRQRL